MRERHRDRNKEREQKERDTDEEKESANERKERKNRQKQEKKIIIRKYLAASKYSRHLQKATAWRGDKELDPQRSFWPGASLGHSVRGKRQVRGEMG